MRTKLARASALMALAFAAASCAEQQRGLPYLGGPTNFGEANRQTMAAQIIDPAPVYTTLEPTTSGDHAAKAIERYNNDKVKRPIKETKTSFGGGQGSSAQH